MNLGAVVPLLALALGAPVLKGVLDGNVGGSAAATRLALALALAYVAPRLLGGLAGGYRRDAEVSEVIEASAREGSPAGDGGTRATAAGDPRGAEASTAGEPGATAAGQPPRRRAEDRSS